ncbi:PadR family transcriptional regulator [Lactobacillus sp. PFC-70]|nr:PadR family transcriptional regulator [Lactobacillus sp. PFC-70]
MKQSQLIKGVLEGCVLAIISQGETYGYQLIQALHHHGFPSLVGGTLYPLLAKLEKGGAIVSVKKPSPDGPARKYYTLTPQGKETFQTFQHQWSQLSGHVNQLIDEVHSNDETPGHPG